jgi:thiol:disulfide interchange protein DsbD
MSLARLFFSACIALIFIPGTLQADAVGDRIGKLIEKVGNAFEDEQFLEPDKAFILTYDIQSPQGILLDWQIADGYYLYRNRFSIKSLTPVISLTEASFPDGKLKDDPEFGEVEVYFHGVQALVLLQRHDATLNTLELEVVYQGCKDGSICYPPIRKTVTLNLPPPEMSVGSNAQVASDAGLLSEQDQISRDLKDRSILLNMLAFLGFGLLLSLTPCIFPMIPILSGIIIGQGQTLSAARAFLMSLAYVLAMALTYAMFGVMAGALEFNIQAAAQNIWVLTGFSMVFVLLALSMFGFYDLQVPASWQERLNLISRSQKQGSLIGAAIMGLLSAIIVGPCVAPPLAGALIYITQTGDALLGGSALFSMGLGMGVPLLLIGTSLGSLLPRAGGWMVTIKYFFGVVLLGVAIWFMSRILPPPVSLFLWGTLIAVSAIYMGALDWRISREGWSRLWQGLAIVLLIYGATMIVGSAGGNGDPFRPLAFSDSGRAARTTNLPFARIKSSEDLDKVLLQASGEGKIVMLDFYADWCIACKEMEHFTFSRAEVHAVLANAILLQADVTANDETDQALMKRFDIIGPPAILFFSNGKELRHLRLYGFMKSGEFIKHVGRLYSR